MRQQSYKIGIIGKDSVYTDKVFTQFQKIPDFANFKMHNSSQAMSAIVSDYYNAFCLIFEEWTNSQVRLVLEIREQFPHKKLLILTPFVNPKLRELISKYENTYILDLDKELHSAPGFLQRLLSGQKVSYRNVNRFRASHFAQIQTLKNTAMCHIKDMSKVGASLQGKFSSMSVGESIQLEMNVPNSNKKYNLKAKVVWVEQHKSKFAFEKDFFTFGLKFETQESSF